MDYKESFSEKNTKLIYIILIIRVFLISLQQILLNTYLYVIRKRLKANCSEGYFPRAD